MDENKVSVTARNGLGLSPRMAPLVLFEAIILFSVAMVIVIGSYSGRWILALSVPMVFTIILGGVTYLNWDNTSEQEVENA